VNKDLRNIDNIIYISSEDDEIAIVTTFLALELTTHINIESVNKIKAGDRIIIVHEHNGNRERHIFVLVQNIDIKMSVGDYETVTITPSKISQISKDEFKACERAYKIKNILEE
jgi:alpha-tubulin suppressor-like RCC1 family protein